MKKIIIVFIIERIIQITKQAILWETLTLISKILKLPNSKHILLDMHEISFENQDPAVNTIPELNQNISVPATYYSRRVLP